MIVASKAAGPSAQMTWIRGGPATLDAANVIQALEGSLRRLGTDYIDLYQPHWPDRCAGQVLSPGWLPALHSNSSQLSGRLPVCL